MSEEDQDKPIILTAKFPSPIVTWATNHSVCAVYSQQSNLIEIYRITFETEKIVELVLEKKPITVELSNDASICIVCFDDGEIEVYKVDQTTSISSTSAEVITRTLYIPLSNDQKAYTISSALSLIDIDTKTSDQVKNQLRLNNFLLFTCDNSNVLSIYFNARIKLLSYTLNSNNSRVKKMSNFQ